MNHNWATELEYIIRNLNKWLQGEIKNTIKTDEDYRTFLEAIVNGELPVFAYCKVREKNNMPPRYKRT